MKPLLYDPDGEIVSTIDSKRQVYRCADIETRKPWSPIVVPPSAWDDLVEEFVVPSPIHRPPPFVQVPEPRAVQSFEAVEEMDKARRKREIFAALQPPPPSVEDDIRTMLHGMVARPVL